MADKESRVSIRPVRNAIRQGKAPPDHRHGDIRAPGQNVMILPSAIQQDGIAVARNGPQGLGIAARTHVHRKAVPAVGDGDDRRDGGNAPAGTAANRESEQARSAPGTRKASLFIGTAQPPPSSNIPIPSPAAPARAYPPRTR